MRFVPFILRNAFRNKRRSILTILSIGMSLFLISTLKTVLDELESPPSTPESAKRVVTRHLTGLGSTMPVAHRDRIRQVPGVEEVIASQWFGGIYKDPSNFFPQFALDAEKFSVVYPEIKPQTPDQMEAFVKLRTGALAGVDLARRFGWKVGDRVTLQGNIFPADPELTLTGLVSGGGSDGNLYFHWDYLNELFPQNISGTFIVKAKDAQDIPAISENVDAVFSNTTAPTKTETESAFILSFASMWGNVRLLLASIATVVIFTVILVAANTMAMSIRERTGEIAILKTVGFAPGQIFTMLIAESVLIALTGGLLGSVGGRLLYQFVNLNSVSQGFIQTMTVRWSTIAMAAGIAIVVAIFSTLIPAYSASRLPIAVAVRRRGE
ncbi:MAG TPA: FtsX-like permease family protein [Terriglobia bacterium]|nr:FtsX-like permease family protein [Terriglobia bacterium]